LIDHGVDVNVQDEYGASSLHRAASKGNGHIVEKILACDGVKVRIDLTDSEGNTPL
jgi:ankyrin repeat protein